MTLSESTTAQQVVTPPPTMQRFLKIIGNGQRTARDLTVDEAEAAIRMVFEGRATPAQVGAFMAALRIKEESSVELATFARVLREYSQRVELNQPHLVDICQPYNGRAKSPSLVPAAAFIAAAAGAKIALHGRPGQVTPPKFGVDSGDVLKRLGVDIDLPLRAVAERIENDKIGVGFVSSAEVSPTLERFNAFRLEYGMRTFFNTIEKLINPFGASTALVGVFHGPVVIPVAEAMRAQQYQRGIALQGPEGSIDVTTTRRTNLIEFASPSDELREWTIDPAAFDWWERGETHGKSYGEEDSAVVVNAQDSAELTMRLLAPANPTDQAFRRGALMTAALMIYAAGRAASFAQGLAMAQQALASGEASERLNRLRAASQALA